MTVKLLTEHHLEFQSLKGGCIGFSESTLIKMPHCWKSHVAAHMIGLSQWQSTVRHIFRFSLNPYIIRLDKLTTKRCMRVDSIFIVPSVLFELKYVFIGKRRTDRYIRISNSICLRNRLKG